MAGKTLTNLSVGIGGSFAGLATAFTGGLKAAEGFGAGISELGSKFMEFAGIGAAVELGMEAIRGVEEAINAGFEMAGHLEAASVAFTGLADSAENAAAIVEHLKALSEGSGLGFDALSSASRKLLSIGMSADAIEPLLRALGDVAAGTGGTLEDMAAIFVKVESEGSLTEKMLKKLGAQGIPVMAELEKRFNTSAAGVKELAKAGRLGMEDLKAAFEGMTGPGGKFAGLMEAQANTVGGIWRRIKETITFTAADIIIALEDIFDVKAVFRGFLEGVQYVGTALKNGLAIIRPYLEAAREWIFNGLGRVWETVKPYLAAAFNFITGAFPGMLQVVSDTMGGIWASIQRVWGGYYNYIAPIVGAVYDVVKNHLAAIIETTINFGLSVWNALEQTIGAMVEIAKAEWDALVAVWNWGCQTITGQTAATADANVTMFESMGSTVGWFFNGLADLITAAVYSIQNFGEILHVAVLGWELLFVKLGNNIAYVFTEVIPHALKYAANGFRDIGELAPRVASDLEKSLVTEGQAMGKHWIVGLGDALNAVHDKSKNATKGIMDAFHAGMANMKAPKDLGLDRKALAPVIKPTINPNDLSLGIQPEIKPPKLIRWGSGEMGFAMAKLAEGLKKPATSPSAPANPMAGLVPAAVAASAVPMTQGGAASPAQDPAGAIAAALNIIKQYIVKWDSNPPLAAASI